MLRTERERERVRERERERERMHAEIATGLFDETDLLWTPALVFALY